MKKERLFKKEYAHELLRIAAHDLAAGHALQVVGHPRGENVLFHYEQAIEKALCGVLCWSGRPLSPGEDLASITDRLESVAWPPRLDEILELGPFAIVHRYQESRVMLSPAELSAAKNLCEEVLDWARKVTRFPEEQHE